MEPRPVTWPFRQPPPRRDELLSPVETPTTPGREVIGYPRVPWAPLKRSTARQLYRQENLKPGRHLCTHGYTRVVAINERE